MVVDLAAVRPRATSHVRGCRPLSPKAVARGSRKQHQTSRKSDLVRGAAAGAADEASTSVVIMNCARVSHASSALSGGGLIVVAEASSLQRLSSLRICVNLRV